MQLPNKLLAATGIFLIVYLLSLLAWIQIKPFYGGLLGRIGVSLAAGAPGFKVARFEQGSDTSSIRFERTVITPKGVGDIQVDIKLSVSSYSFNVPLTFALVMALLYIFDWPKWILLEAAAILVAIHLLYVYAFCSLELFKHITSGEGALISVKPPSKPLQFLLQFLWAFTENMVIRFEPFLVAVYLWLRSSPRKKAHR